MEKNPTVAQWYNDVDYVIKLMARRNAYFTEWEVRDLVGPTPDGAAVTLTTLLENAEFCGTIRLATEEDTLVDGSKRAIWIGTGHV